jgi:hypothetical protein
MSLAFIDVFFAKQHQAMLILQEILFGTFTVVLIGRFLKLTKTFFTYVLVFSERPFFSHCTIFTFS